MATRVQARQYGFACAILVNLDLEKIFPDTYPAVQNTLHRYDGEVVVEATGAVGVEPNGRFHVGVAHASEERQAEYWAMLEECEAHKGYVKPSFWVSGNCSS